jgi:hypothetical protein
MFLYEAACCLLLLIQSARSISIDQRLWLGALWSPWRSFGRQGYSDFHIYIAWRLSFNCSWFEETSKSVKLWISYSTCQSCIILARMGGGLALLPFEKSSTLVLDWILLYPGQILDALAGKKEQHNYVLALWLEEFSTKIVKWKLQHHLELEKILPFFEVA